MRLSVLVFLRCIESHEQTVIPTVFRTSPCSVTHDYCTTSALQMWSSSEADGLLFIWRNSQGQIERFYLKITRGVEGAATPPWWMTENTPVQYMYCRLSRPPTRTQKLETAQPAYLSACPFTSFKSCPLCVIKPNINFSFINKYTSENFLGV